MRVLLLFIFTSFHLFAIVNTEVYRNTDINKNKHQLNLGFSLSDGNSNQSRMSLSHRYDFGIEDVSGFTVSSFQQSQVNGSKTKDNIFTHLRFSKSFFKTSYYECFFQYENDAFRNIASRYLYGLGRRFELSNLIYLGLGAMLENETLTEKISTEKISTEKTSTLRSTNYISFVTRLNSLTKLKGTVYYQPLFSDFSNYRLSLQVNNSISLSKNIAFQNVAQYKFYSHLPDNVKNADLFLSSSITLLF